MKSDNPLYYYLPDGTSFTSDKAAQIRMIYLPLCGPEANSLKSSITPFLSGDIKIDKSHYLTKPSSREDLRQGVRNFFIAIEGKGFCSLAEETDWNVSSVDVGQLWQKLTRRNAAWGLEISALNFIPSSGEPCELMRVLIKNISERAILISPTGMIPLFGRSLANKHDHEHVTSLLNRTRQLDEGVLLEPTMVFNEEGHQVNDCVYYVFGIDSQSRKPIGTFPTNDSFYGASGNFYRPEAIVENQRPRMLSDDEMQGKESLGALRFEDVPLEPGQSLEYFLVFGIAESPEEAKKTFGRFATAEKMGRAFEETCRYWTGKSQSIRLSTGDATFNSWMSWVTLQPVLRRIFGNSFLPDHDYGKGGRGWRDIWQDLLSLILIEPQEVRQHLVNNFAGVRIDGTNATIIGTKPGEFIADRNSIVRVWMDHGLWPLSTILLYMEQTGDFDILFKENTYFRDQQLSRTFVKDLKWTPEEGNRLKTKQGEIYQGTLLEHILVQHLVQFFNVGEHNLIRLESADWNDGLDMAFERGESVAFTSFYGGNLLALADCLEYLLAKKKLKTISLAKELAVLFDSFSANPCRYDNYKDKKDLLFNRYFKSVEPVLSGQQKDFSVEKVISDLRKKGQFIFDWIREKEWIAVKDGQGTSRWLNGYYDNSGKCVEGQKKQRTWMTLTGQVFPIMSGLTNAQETHEIVHSVRRYLKDENLGGIRLNTDFGLDHYLELGRAFGFAYGTKENGAFFSHMNVMYAYALYSKGFAREGYEVLRSIYTMCMDTDKSKIFPGVPEYFDSQGRGMYHYLTGSASWYVLTQLTQVFGVRGHKGDLLLDPKLLAEEFNDDGEAQVECQFAGQKIAVRYVNVKKLDYGAYRIEAILLNEEPLTIQDGIVPRKLFSRGHAKTATITVILS